jgi:ABC-type multidrug transport system fused ATPase/permease subunit
VSQRIRIWWEQLGFGTERHTRRVLILAAFGLVSGLGEAAVVVLAVALASGGSGGRLPLLGESPPGSGTLTALALGSLVLLAAAHYGSARATARFGAEALESLQRLLASAFLRAPWAAQSAAPPGELQDVVLRNAGLVALGTQHAATGVATALNLAVVVVAAMLVSPWATLLLGIAMAVVVAAGIPLRARTRQASRSGTAALTETAADLTEKASLARDLRVFGVTERALEELQARIGAAARLQRAIRQIALATPRLTRDIAVALLVVGISVVVSTSDIAFSTLVLAVVLVFRALGLAQALAGVAQAMVERRANLDVVQSRLRAWRPAETPGTEPCPAVTRVEFVGVTHRYSSAAAPALKAVDLTIAKGEMLGLVGRSGSGKTTLASVLLGLLQPSEGTVEVDGVPLVALDPADWHARTAWVGQEPRLLTGTVAENIRFLRPWIDDEAVRSAVAAAGLQGEVAAWPEGLAHPVGPAGGGLSGGERQRVALARAVAGDPDLIVLDEPTSALDAHTEAAVRDALDELRERAAVVIIAHRLSTIRSCDRVAVMEAGRIVAIAPPGELEAASPWFKRALELSSAAEPLR